MIIMMKKIKIKKFKAPLNLFLTALFITPSLLLLLIGCSEDIKIEPSQSNNSPSQQTELTPSLGRKADPGPTRPFAVTDTPKSDSVPQTNSYLEGTYNCFAQGVPSASGYANTYLFRPDGTWADITYGKQYASNPKYDFTYRLNGPDLTLIYPSGNSDYKVETDNGKYKLVQYGDKNNQTCYQHVE